MMGKCLSAIRRNRVVPEERDPIPERIPRWKVSIKKLAPAGDDGVSSEPENGDGTETSEAGRCTTKPHCSNGHCDGQLTVESLDKNNVSAVDSEVEFFPISLLVQGIACQLFQPSGGNEETQRSGPVIGSCARKPMNAKKDPRVLPGAEKAGKAAMEKLASHTGISFSDLLPEKGKERSRRAQPEFDEGRVSHTRRRNPRKPTGVLQNISATSVTTSHTTSPSGGESSEDPQNGRESCARRRNPRKPPGVLQKISAPSATTSHTTSPSGGESSEDSYNGRESCARCRTRMGAFPKSKGPASRVSTGISQSGNFSGEEPDAQARNSPNRAPPDAIMKGKVSAARKATVTTTIFSYVSLGGNFSDGESDGQCSSHAQTRNSADGSTPSDVPTSEGPPPRAPTDISQSGNFSRDEPEERRPGDAQGRNSPDRPPPEAVPKRRGPTVRKSTKLTTILSDISLGGYFSDEEPDEQYSSRAQIRFPPRRPSGAIPKKGVFIRKGVSAAPSEKAVAGGISSTDSSLSDSVLGDSEVEIGSSEEEQKSVHSINVDDTGGERQSEVASTASSRADSPSGDDETGQEPIPVAGVSCQGFRPAGASLSEVCSDTEGREERSRRPRPKTAARPVALASRSKKLVGGTRQEQIPYGRRRFGERRCDDDDILKQMLVTFPIDNATEEKERDHEHKPSDHSRGEMAACPVALASGSKEGSTREPAELVGFPGQEHVPCGRRRFGRGRRWEDDSLLDKMLVTFPVENETGGQERQHEHHDSSSKSALWDRSTREMAARPVALASRSKKRSTREPAELVGFTGQEQVPCGHKNGSSCKSVLRERSRREVTPKDACTVLPRAKRSKKAVLARKSPEVSLAGIFSSDDETATDQQKRDENVRTVPRAERLNEFPPSVKERKTKIATNSRVKKAAAGDGSSSVALYDEEDLQLMEEILEECG